MKIKQQENDVIVFEPKVFEDHRGFFCETYRKDIMQSLGFNYEFVQDNHSRSSKGVLRGLHFQWQPAMGKLMRVTNGNCLLIAVDVRHDSPNLGKHFAIEVSSENKLQVWAPPGFARGFCVLSDWAEIQYKCTGIYNSQHEGGIAWNDPELGINWKIDNPTLSERDTKAMTLREWISSPNGKVFSIKDSL